MAYDLSHIEPLLLEFRVLVARHGTAEATRRIGRPIDTNLREQFYVVSEQHVGDDVLVLPTEELRRCLKALWA